MSASLPEHEPIAAESGAALPQSALRRTFSALAYRDFRLLWFGAFTSTTGTWMQTVAQSWVVLSMTGSAFLLGVDGFLATGPMLFFSLFGGVVADRMERRKVMLWSQYLQMTFAFILGLLILSGQVKVWHIFLLSFLTGSAQSFSGPAYISLLPLLVKREDVPNAIAMNSMQFNLARVIGPILAGLALTAFGAAVCFGLNGLSFVAVIIALLLIHPPRATATGEKGSIFEEMRAGFRFVTTRPSLLLLTFLAFAGTFLGMPIITFLPVVAKQIFHLDARGYSWLLTAYGLGSVGGALFVAASGHIAKKGKLALALQLSFACLITGFAFSRRLPLSMAIAFCAGACIVGVISMYSSLVQLTTNDAMRGRVMSIFMLAFRGGMPLGNLLAGYVAQRWSISTALAVNGSILAVIAAVFILRGTDLDAELIEAKA
ncbi:MAG TPA: MFS transporter [Thermoanaerobaculia bacterium]|jgi:predicted MFS family arabinose efflux permease|nr:MFS transporter [Thermoanaerobaculia bacterium]